MWIEIVSFIILALTALILLYTAFISYKTGKTAKTTLQHNVILDLQEKYRSTDMLIALRSLWDLYDDCFNKLKYKNMMELNETQKEKLKDEFMNEYEKKYYKEKTNLNKQSFDNQRRLVSYFYNHLYNLYLNEIIDENTLKNLFNDIETIKNISIPLEERLVELIWNKRGLTAKQIEDKKYHATRNLKYLVDMLKNS